MFRSLLRIPPRFSGVSILSRFASSSTTTSFLSVNARSIPSVSQFHNSPLLQQLYMNKNASFKPIQPIEYNFDIVEEDENNTMHALSVLRKRRLKMKKHKYKKRRKAQRALRKRLGK